MDETLVTFGSGATAGRGRVLAVVAATSGAGPSVVVDETPFHPVDHTWPDQPGDHGSLDGRPVADTLMAAASPGGEPFLGTDIPVRRGEEGWTWLVAHQLAAGVDAPAVGDEIDLQVDTTRRNRLSAAHTACHLAALAMNRAAAPLWLKEARRDSLGSPDLDQIAMQTSVMDPTGSTDTYRLGKSLRKKGFDAALLREQLDEIRQSVAAQLAAWVGTRAPVEVRDDGDRRITAPRRWSCALPEGLAELPCGGTHVRDLGQFSGIEVDYRFSEDGTGLTVRTTPRLRDADA